MVSSISSSSSYIQQLMSELLKNMSSVKTAGAADVSSDALSSVGSGSEVEGSDFLKKLSEKFDKINTDGNVQLSADEISAFNPTQKKPMGPPPNLMDELFSSDSNSSKGLTVDELFSIDTSASKGLNNCVSNLIEKFDSIDTNKDGELSSAEIDASKPSGSAPSRKADGESQSSAAYASSNGSSAAEESFAHKIADFLTKQLTELYKDSLSSASSSVEVAG